MLYRPIKDLMEEDSYEVPNWLIALGILALVIIAIFEIINYYVMG